MWCVSAPYRRQQPDEERAAYDEHQPDGQRRRQRAADGRAALPLREMEGVVALRILILTGGPVCVLPPQFARDEERPPLYAAHVGNGAAVILVILTRHQSYRWQTT